MGPHPAVAELRAAVRRLVADLNPGDLVLAACSGGADSLALAAALAFVAPRLGLRGGGVTVDHQLQPGSAQQAARAAAQMTGLGLAPVEIRTVTVEGAGGPEAAARTARYRALDETAEATGAAAILLGHTRDDQAEAVLLGLARGSGGRSLAGMAERSGRYRRPFLDVGRDRTQAACDVLGLAAWADPQNADGRYARARVRHHVLPVLEEALGPGIAEALARTARQLRADADVLDELARQAAGPLILPGAEPDAAGSLTRPGPELDAAGLIGLPTAVRTRVLRYAALAAGCGAGSLTATHIERLDELLTGWHGQRGVDLPGGVRGVRECGKLRFIIGGSKDSSQDGRRDPEDTEGADGRERHGSRSEGGADHLRAASAARRGARGPD
jgi:tRNA(Ile)-lysidine synthase